VTNARFKVFTTVGIKVNVFWVVTPCSVVVGYRCFRGSCCHGPLKCWYATTTLHGIATQKILTWNITTMKALKL